MGEGRQHQSGGLGAHALRQLGQRRGLPPSEQPVDLRLVAQGRRAGRGPRRPAVNGSPLDLILLLGLGVIGFGMRRFGFPVLPLIGGVIMGPLIELQGRRALQLASGSPRGFFGGVDIQTGSFTVSALAVTAYAIIVIVLLWPLVWSLLRRRRTVPTDGPALEAPSEATRGSLR